MPERSFFGAFAFTGAIAVAVALWTASVYKEKNATAARLLEAQGKLTNLAAQHETQLADLKKEHDQQILDLDDQWQARLDGLKIRQADRLREAYAQFNELVGESNYALNYIGELEQKLRGGAEATDVELEQLAAMASGLSVLASQYQRPMAEFSQLGVYLTQRATNTPNAPKSRISFVKRIFSSSFREQEKEYLRDVGRQQAFQEAQAKFTTVYKKTQQEMARSTTQLQAQADKLYALAETKKASLDDLKEFFDTSRRTLHHHQQILDYVPEIELPPVGDTPGL